ncbi:MAG: acyltransferase [Muribaculaceae bacterium]
MIIKSGKINWLLILQGWSMLLVVIGHAGLSGIARNPNEPVISLIETIIYSFHMPLFMAISGYLLYSVSKVKKQSNYQFMLGKFVRLGIPFLFFTIATLAIKPFFNSVVNRPTTFGWSEFTHVLLYPSDNPLGELWFISALFWIFALSPILLVAIRKTWSILVMLSILLVCSQISFSWGGLFGINSIMAYLLWFYIGILGSKFDIHKLLFGYFRMILSIISFGILFIVGCYYHTPVISILTTLSGCIMSVSLAVNADRLFPLIFNSFRNYTYQIFLMGIFFQCGFRIIYRHTLDPDYYVLCYIFNILLGVYVPVLIVKVIQRINCKYINPLFGLK